MNECCLLLLLLLYFLFIDVDVNTSCRVYVDLKKIQRRTALKEKQKRERETTHLVSSLGFHTRCLDAMLTKLTSEDLILGFPLLHLLSK